jgi:hypothetical protein
MSIQYAFSSQAVNDVGARVEGVISRSSSLQKQSAAPTDADSELISLSASFVLLEGDFLAKREDIYACFGYTDSQAQYQLHAFTDLAQHLTARHRTLKAAGICQGWTIVLDLENTLVADDVACAELSLLYHSRVLAICADWQHKSYALSLFAEDEVCRDLRVVNGVVRKNFGESLAGEPNALALLTARDLLAVARTLGIDLLAWQHCDCFFVDDFTPTSDWHESYCSLLCAGADKPWWHFWN